MFSQTNIIAFFLTILVCFLIFPSSSISFCVFRHRDSGRGDRRGSGRGGGLDSGRGNGRNNGKDKTWNNGQNGGIGGGKLGGRAKLPVLAAIVILLCDIGYEIVNFNVTIKE